MHRALSLFAAAVLVCSGAAPASARQPASSVAIGALAFTGEVTDGVRAVVVERLRSGLLATGVPVAPTEVVARALGDDFGRCSDPDCWRKLWVKLGSRYVVGGRIEGHDRSYEIELWLADARRGAHLARLQHSCEICGLQAIADRVDLAASALAARLQQTVREPARLAIEVEPATATVSVDGKPRGSGPQELVVAAGKRQITVEQPGYLTAKREIVALSGVEERIRIRLIPGAPPGSGWRTAGWVGIGAGAAALGVGIALVAIDGQHADCREATTVAGGQCAGVLSTAAGGWTLSSLGVAALLGGAYLVYRGHRSHRSHRGDRGEHGDRAADQPSTRPPLDGPAAVPLTFRF